MQRNLEAHRKLTLPVKRLGTRIRTSNQLQLERLLRGRSRRMLLQRNSRLGAHQIARLVAAAQHDFPKPDVQIGLTCRTPNRAFAAPVMDVSVADEAVTRLYGVKERERPETAVGLTSVMLRRDPSFG